MQAAKPAQPSAAQQAPTELQPTEVVDDKREAAAPAQAALSKMDKRRLAREEAALRSQRAARAQQRVQLWRCVDACFAVALLPMLSLGYAVRRLNKC